MRHVQGNDKGAKRTGQEELTLDRGQNKVCRVQYKKRQDRTQGDSGGNRSRTNAVQDRT